MSRRLIYPNIAWDELRQRFYVTLDYGKTKEGKRNRKTKSFKELFDAEQWLMEYKIRKKNNNLIKPSEKNVGEYCLYWLNTTVVPNCKLSTISGYQSTINNHIIPQIGDISLQELTVERVNEYFIHLKNDKEFSNSTISKHRALLKQALQKAVTENKVEDNVVRKATVYTGKADKVQVFGGEEIQQLMEKIQGHRLELPVCLALFLGLRRGEINGLRWQDVNFQKQQIFVVNNRIQVKGKIQEGEPKSEQSIRKIFCNQYIIKLLKATKERQENVANAQGEVVTGMDYVWRKENNELWSTNYISSAFDRFLKKNGIRHLKFHGLRHTCASLAILDEVAIYDISRLLGHSSTSITEDVYVCQLKQDNKRAADGVTRVISKYCEQGEKSKVNKKSSSKPKKKKKNKGKSKIA